MDRYAEASPWHAPAHLLIRTDVAVDVYARAARLAERSSETDTRRPRHPTIFNDSSGTDDESVDLARRRKAIADDADEIHARWRAARNVVWDARR